MEQSFEPMTDEELILLKVKNINETDGKLDETDGYNCEKCRNKGYIMKAVLRDGNWQEVMCDCVCKPTRATIRRMKRSGLKDIIRDYTFAKYEAAEDWQRKLKDAASQYAENPHGWFFVGGQSGAGKTHLCTAICRELLLRGKEVRYMLWRDDIIKLKSSVNDASVYEPLMDSYKRCEVLYIDDLFKTGKSADGTRQQPTSADIHTAFEILNFRYNNPGLLTIISSECTVAEIIDIDEATGGRIFERAAAFSLKPDKKKNYRLKGVTEL